MWLSFLRLSYIVTLQTFTLLDLGTFKFKFVFPETCTRNSLLLTLALKTLGLSTEDLELEDDENITLDVFKEGM